jgi:hypothetical protein
MRLARWTRLIFLGSVLVPSACTRGNPAFDAGSEDGTTVGSASAGSVSTGGGETSTLGTTGPDATTLGPMTTQGVDDTATTAVATTGESLTDGTTGEPACMLHVDDPILMTVLDADMAVIPSACGAMQQTDYGRISVGDGVLSFQPCPACACAESDPTLTIEFEGSLSLPPMLPPCGVLAVWAQPEPVAGKAECPWEGFAVFENAPPIPTYLGSNSRHLPESLFLAVAVALVEEEACALNPAGCIETPAGRYGLSFADDTPVFVGPPIVVNIAFAAELPYLVTTRMASIDGVCREHVSWTARAEL